MKNGHIIAFIAAIFTLVSAPVAAQQGASAQQGKAIETSGDVKVVKTVTSDAGDVQTVLVDPDIVTPGDRLRFRTEYTNVSDELVENFVMTRPLNSALRLVPGDNGGAQLSVDDGQTYGSIGELTVKTEDGAVRPATESDVTHLRWTVPQIEAGATGEIIFHVIIR